MPHTCSQAALYKAWEQPPKQEQSLRRMISVGKRCWGPVSVESVDQVWNKCELNKVRLMWTSGMAMLCMALRITHQSSLPFSPCHDRPQLPLAPSHLLHPSLFPIL